MLLAMNQEEERNGEYLLPWHRKLCHLAHLRRVSYTYLHRGRNAVTMPR